MYRQAEIVMPVPPSNPNKPFDLPTLLATTVAELTGKTAMLGCMTKTRPTIPMKDLSRLSEKRDNVSGAFAIVDDGVRGKRAIVIDDLYDSGETISEVARMLRAGGTSQVLGLVAVKTQSF